MIAKIEIECETAGELLQHLEVISNTIKKECEGGKEPDFEEGFSFNDNNCHGSHEVEISGDDTNY